MDTNGTRPIAFPPNTIRDRHPKRDEERRKQSEEEASEFTGEESLFHTGEEGPEEEAKKLSEEPDDDGKPKNIIDIRV